MRTKRLEEEQLLNLLDVFCFGVVECTTVSPNPRLVMSQPYVRFL